MSANRGKEHRFPKSVKRRLLAQADGKCSVCKRPLTMQTAEPHHIIPVCEGGDTVAANGIIVCRDCHVAIHQQHICA